MIKQCNNPWCGKKFETHKNNVRYCSKECAKFIRQKKKNSKIPLENILKKCENCGKEHDGSYASGRFCCKSCYKSFATKKFKASKKFQKHLNDIHNSNRAPYGTWKCNICGKICFTKHLLKQHYLLEHAYTQSGLIKIQDDIYQYECKYCHKKFKNAKMGGGHMINCPNHPNKDKYTLSHKQSGKTLSKKIHDGELIPYWQGRKHSSESCKKMRIKAIKRISTLKGQFNCNYNKKSIQFFDNLSKKNNWNLQHAENGGEFYTGIGYWLDAYDKEKNIVVEYDESYHYDDVLNNILREKDLKRQKEIIEHLGCEYWRYNETTKCLWKVEI